MSAGWYTVQVSKDGYITSTFNVYACGDISGQDTSISTTLDTGAMRIVLSWKTATDDLDSHLTGPDNLSRQGHRLMLLMSSFIYIMITAPFFTMP